MLASLCLLEAEKRENSRVVQKEFDHYSLPLQAINSCCKAFISNIHKNTNPTVEYLAQHIESLIFTCEQPISFTEIKGALEETFETKFKEEELQEAIQELTEHYQQDQSSFEIIKLAGGYQFLTKGAFHATVGTYLKQKIKKRLSRAALETLAIVAYKQPVTKGGIEGIRGVNCDYAMQKLLEKELVSIAGRSDAPGRPLLYITSDKFMNYFGIESIKDLPKIKEFQQTDNSIGEAAPIEEEIVLDTHLPKEDDIVHIAIAVANIFDPLPPADLLENLAEAAAEIIEEAEEMEAAEEAGTSAADEAPTPIAESQDTPSGDSEPAESTEASAETTAEEEEAISEFVTATKGEFTGDQNNTAAEESETVDSEIAEADNHTSAEDVVIEEETAPIKEDGVGH